MIDSVDVVPGRYHDSVRLMQISREVAAAPGVTDVLVAMATELNRALLTDMGFDAGAAAEAGPDDLIVAVRAVDEATLAAGRETVDRLMESTPPPVAGVGHEAPAARTIASAGRGIGANLALISVPGPHAFVEAMDALRSGMHVMIFSDNVPIGDEVTLKETGEAAGLLVMGPDCGTAVVAGVGIGFSNAVRPGPVGIAGASGTGIQQLCCLLDAAGVGVRHALGTGSRDLSAAVGGRSTRMALAALDTDPDAELIAVISKPPDRHVADEVERAAAALKTPTVAVWLGTPGVTIEGAAYAMLDRLGVPRPSFRSWMPDSLAAPRPGSLRGFFSGGSLRDEAHQIAAGVLPSVASDPRHAGHRLVDYGADEFTRGRPHPMIDSTMRLEAMADAVDDPTTSTVLFDVVLGYGAHPDPADELTAVVRDATTRGVAVVVSLCGTERDPQDIERQATALAGAGAEVYASNAAAARRAVALVEEAS